MPLASARCRGRRGSVRTAAPPSAGPGCMHACAITCIIESCFKPSGLEKKGNTSIDGPAYKVGLAEAEKVPPLIPAAAAAQLLIHHCEFCNTAASAATIVHCGPTLRAPRDTK
eukprot:1161097-Pelagomonas_calceolata.AAC.8